MLIRLDGVVVQIEKFIILAGVKWALIHMMNAHARVRTHITKERNTPAMIY